MTKRNAEPGVVRAAWLPYAAATLGLAGAVAAVATLALPAAEAAGVRVAAVVASGAQLAAFGLLMLGRTRADLFLAGWLGGMVLRFGALALMTFWVTRQAGAAPAATLLSLVGMLFMMLLLEPLFLRRGRETR